jgi:hypothetical protein
MFTVFIVPAGFFLAYRGNASTGDIAVGQVAVGQV